ncbi:hypothetical protein ABAZ39_26270 (plasmid) [Azospirillum argentinense]|uniref:Pilus assembly protein n=1 Tax=Azospirillum argentinense TaxID=2970906 RepID=A0A060DRU2_9PROT|nr:MULTISPECIES: hypothetical protein [Azospirillum]AIB15400.1 hypothetical protein ABAZ39_26270 [Azospirillum argentinense]EZQ04198.1 hypothetical protein ABAZ39_24635 [Azospirillum argentinense]
MGHLPGRLARNRSGLVTIEVAGIALAFVLLLVAAVDFSQHVSAVGKIARAASETAKIATQFKRLRQGMTVQRGDEVGVLFEAARQVAQPLDIDKVGAVIVTSVANSGSGGSKVAWQQRSGSSSWTSRIGSAVGGAATLPSAFSIRSGDSAVFVEVFHTYQPTVLSGSLFGGDPSGVPVYSQAVSRPRFGDLTILDP